jgi:HEAT repeat protein
MNEMNDTKVAFQKVLEALLDERQSFPQRYLYEFSDIEPASLQALLEVWPRVTPSRKRILLKELEELAESDTLLSFDELARALLNDPDSKVRRQAIRLLFECEDAKLVPTYLAMLTCDKDHEVRAEAATALGAFVKLGEWEKLAAQTHHQIEDQLLEVVNNDKHHPPVRRQALESLGYSSRPEVPPLLESAYNRQDPDWTASALFAMGRSADERWQDQVIRMLLSENRRVRLAAVQAAGELSLKLARAPMLHMLEDEEDEIVLGAALWSLSQIGGEDVRTYLMGLLDQCETDEQAAYLEEVLDNLAFTEDMEHFDLMNIDPEEEPED